MSDAPVAVVSELAHTLNEVTLKLKRNPDNQEIRASAKSTLQKYADEAKKEKHALRLWEKLKKLIDKLELTPASEVKKEEKADSAIMEKYFKAVKSRHKRLPDSLWEDMKKAKSKGEAKRTLRDYLRSKVS